MLTNKVAVEPLSTTAMLPQGSLVCEPDHTVASCPLASKTSMQPGPLVAVVPSLLGVLPTITQPLLSTVIAVLRPTPPGHCGRFCGNLAKSVVEWLAGLISTIVPPVPCKLERLLKLSTSTSPLWILPTLAGATTTA